MLSRLSSFSGGNHSFVAALRATRRLAATNASPKPVDTNSAPRPMRSQASAQKESVTVTVKDEVAVVKINCPDAKENTINEAMSRDLKLAMERIENDNGIRSAVIMSGKPNSFIAGADIGMIARTKSVVETESLSKEGQKEFARIESSRKPIVAAIMGTCMGGGLELALACHYRIAVNSPKTSLALPEVMLGLLPGAGGTQRLPKLVSITTALDMMLTGKTLKASKAKKVGLVDQIVEPIGAGVKSLEQNNLDYLEKVAVDVAKQMASGALKPMRTRPWIERITNYFLTRPPLLDNVLIKSGTKKVMKQTAGNYPAPLRILDVVKAGLSSSDGSGYDQEAKAFGELSKTNQSKALIGIFHGSTACKKNKWGAPAKKTEKLAVVGAGLMGAGIANVSIDKGLPTVLIDMHDEGLARGLNQIHTHLETGYKKKKISMMERANAMAALKFSTTYNDLKDCDIAIEAVFEDIGVKHKVIQQLEAVVPEHCVIASNTSALPITEIAKGSSRPEKIIGMHYFSPVEKMQLLEIITTAKTSPETLKVAANLGLMQKKTIVVVKDCPGFFVVRCLAPMMSEISRLMQEGVGPEALDELTKAFGFPVGAATLGDEVGLDVAEHVAKFLEKAVGPRMGGGSVALLSEMIAAGYKGRKSGKGYYVYGAGKKGKRVNEAAMKIIEKHHSTAPAAVSGREDQQLRVICRYINEAALCLQENIISSPVDGDVASVFGIGFPPFWGGPFRFLDLYGIDKFLNHMGRYAEVYPAEQFQPAPILLDYSKANKKFHPH